MDASVYEQGAVGGAPAPPVAPSVGNPSNGVPGGVAPTNPGAYWFYQIQKSFETLFTEAGIPPDHTDLTLLLQVFKKLGLQQATQAQIGVSEIATDAEVQAGADMQRIITPAGLASFPQLLGGSAGYQILPGGLIIQWMVGSAGNPTPIDNVLPITFPTSHGVSVAVHRGGAAPYNVVMGTATNSTVPVEGDGSDGGAVYIISVGF